MTPPWKVFLRQNSKGWWEWSQLHDTEWSGEYKTESVVRGIAKRALTRLYGNGGIHDPDNFEFIVIPSTQKKEAA